jgi:hypothetical protein
MKFSRFRSNRPQVTRRDSRMRPLARRRIPDFRVNTQLDSRDKNRARCTQCGCEPTTRSTPRSISQRASSRCSSVIFSLFSIPQWTKQTTTFACDRACVIAGPSFARTEAAAIWLFGVGSTSLIASRAILFPSDREKKRGSQALPGWCFNSDCLNFVAEFFRCGGWSLRAPEQINLLSFSCRSSGLVFPRKLQWPKPHWAIMTCLGDRCFAAESRRRVSFHRARDRYRPARVHGRNDCGPSDSSRLQEQNRFWV